MLSGSSPITDPRLRRKRTRSQGPLLRRHYPASSCRRHAPHVRSYDLSVTRPVRRLTRRRRRDLRPVRASPDYPQHLDQRAVPTTPADRDGCMRRLLPHPTRPSPLFGRVGIRDITFEACSGFTRVTAHWLAQPPKAAFVARLRPLRLPERAACQLPDQSTTLWVEPTSTGTTRRRGAPNRMG